MEVMGMAATSSFLTVLPYSLLALADTATTAMVLGSAPIPVCRLVLLSV